MADEPNPIVAPSTRPASAARFALACVASFGIPLLLCASLVLVLRIDMDAHRSANDVLLPQIGKLDAQLVDVKDLYKINSQVLARKQIVEVLQRSAWSAEVALDVFGHLPDGVQLQTLKMDARHMAFDIRYAAGGDLALLTLLAQHGQPDLRVAERRHDEGSGFERASIAVFEPGTTEALPAHGGSR